MDLWYSNDTLESYKHKRAECCRYAGFSLHWPLGQFSLVVAMSICMYVSMYVCMYVCMLSPYHAIYSVGIFLSARLPETETKINYIFFLFIFLLQGASIGTR